MYQNHLAAILGTWAGAPLIIAWFAVTIAGAAVLTLLAARRRRHDRRTAGLTRDARCPVPAGPHYPQTPGGQSRPSGHAVAHRK